jgi:hypothetical protein
MRGRGRAEVHQATLLTQTLSEKSVAMVNLGRGEVHPTHCPSPRNGGGGESDRRRLRLLGLPPGPIQPPAGGPPGIAPTLAVVIGLHDHCQTSHRDVETLTETVGWWPGDSAPTTWRPPSGDSTWHTAGS